MPWGDKANTFAGGLFSVPRTMKNQKPELPSQLSHAGAVAPASTDTAPRRPKRLSRNRRRQLIHWLAKFGEFLRASRDQHPLAALADHIAKNGRSPL